MAFLSFLAGAVAALALIVLLVPWLRTIPRLAALPQLPWQAGLGALLVLCAATATSVWSSHAGDEDARAAVAAVRTSTVPAAVADSSATAWADVASALQAGPAAAASAPGNKPAAMSMDAAVASLEARLAAGNGSPDDWELLAKSYEFLNRPADAARARTHRLPAAAAPDPAAAGAAVSGQVSLAPALRDKAPGGAILFIIAKAVDQPGAPVAVLRSTVHDWPVRFRLDDSHSMLPGHTLSSAGKVTIEARISQSGQPLAGAGDLQGVMGPVDPASNPVLSIVIDKVLR